ncbi:hypothetical protein CDAR_217451, partial [Caerostris darwini]
MYRSTGISHTGYSMLRLSFLLVKQEDNAKTKKR